MKNKVIESVGQERVTGRCVHNGYVNAIYPVVCPTIKGVCVQHSPPTVVIGKPVERCGSEVVTAPEERGAGTDNGQSTSIVARSVIKEEARRGVNSGRNNRMRWTTEQARCESDLMKVVETADGQLVVQLKEAEASVPMNLLVSMDCNRGICDCVLKIMNIRCQLKPCRLFCELFFRGSVDCDYLYLLTGVCFGFRVIDGGFSGMYDSAGSKRMSGWEHDLIEEKFRFELGEGMITEVATPQCIHGVFVVPKDDGGGRSVIDCSRPRGKSVNEATGTIASKFKYKGVDDVVEMLQRDDFLSSIDIKDAYRAVHIHPGDRTKQGLKWKFKGERVFTYMVDNRLCMGLSSSPFIFSCISDFVVRCAEREGVRRIVNYLDDFCIVGSSREEAASHQHIVIAVLRRLGFWISFKKLKSPCRKIRFLGIDIDAGKLELSLPVDKMEKLLGILGKFQGKRKATRKELERLGGLLAHCAKVIRGGRTFSRRVYDLIASLREPFYSVRLNAGFREDICWWREFAVGFNGKASMLGKFATIYSVYSDASSWGFGATHQDDWLVGTFVSKDAGALERYSGHHFSGAGSLSEEHINIKEMWGVYAGALRWAQAWRDGSIIFVTDSVVVQTALNTGRSRSVGVMGYIRKLFWLSVKYNFTFISTYINTTRNVMCDALSRLDRGDSTGRIRGVDEARRMCCAGVFDSELFSTSRVGVEGGAGDLCGALLRPEFEDDQGGAGQALPGICR